MDAVEARLPVEALAALSPGQAEAVVRAMAAETLAALAWDWPAWVHAGQAPPTREDWLIWLMMGGRGFGKTRAGAEWVSAMARAHPEARIALVAATTDEARRVMVEGPSGLIAAARPEEREAMRWEPSLRRLSFASGALGFVYSGADPEALRGPAHDFAWCDELAKWRRAQAAWDNLMLGLRRGERPRCLVTTTPRSTALLREMIGGGAATTGGPSRANPHNAPAWLAEMERRHAGTRLGRQELDGEMIEEAEGALWPRARIEEWRVSGDGCFPDGGASAAAGARESNCPLRRIVVGVDPPASVGGTCGIVVCGIDGAGMGRVLADASVGGVSPEGWARKVAATAQEWRAALVVAEANNGGRMVETVLRGAGLTLPLRLVHASEGKVARAAPVATAFEAGRARFAGRFPALEDELAGLSWGGGYEGPGSSPDRADAMVWAMTELLLGRERGEPRVRSL